MPLPEPSTKYCLFKRLDKGIWEFVFLKSSNEAIDEWITWQNYLSSLPPEPDVTMVRTLLDFRPDGLVSMLYTLQKNAEWRRQKPDIQAIPVKVAFVMRPLNQFQRVYSDLINEGVNAFGMRKVRIQLFPDAYEKAVEWLLED